MALYVLSVALIAVGLWHAPVVDAVDLNVLCQDVRFGTFPHPSDCRQYVLCILSAPVVVPCPAGYVFHPDVQFCVQESQYRCGSDAAVTTTPEPSSTVGTSTSTLEPECVRRPNWESFFCDGVRRRLVTNPMNCTQYIHCQEELPKNHLCPAGTVFNDLYQDCLSGDGQSCALATVDEDFCANLTDGTYAHPYQCNRFISCVRQQLRLESCPPFYVFNPAVGHCVKGSVLTCSSLLN